MAPTAQGVVQQMEKLWAQQWWNVAFDDAILQALANAVKDVVIRKASIHVEVAIQSDPYEVQTFLDAHLDQVSRLTYLNACAAHRVLALF